MNGQHFADVVVIPVLRQMGERFASRSAVALLTGIAAHESFGFSRLTQIRGPALGFVQMEPQVIEDIDKNFLAFRPELQGNVNRFRHQALPVGQEFVTNLALQVVYARLHLWRVQEPLPDHTDLWAMAGYWKQHYNTAAGKGTREKFVDDWNRYVRRLSYEGFNGKSFL